MNQEQILKKIMKVNILADIIEAEITAINPIRNVLDYNSMQVLNSLESSCKRLRKHFDKTSPVYADAIGEVSDIVDLQINDVL